MDEEPDWRFVQGRDRALDRGELGLDQRGRR
jgi:hypothetical protein